MPRKRKISKKILKEPDELVSFSSMAVEYARNNYRTIVPMVVIVVLIALIATAWIYYSRGREKDASLLFYQAKQFYRSSRTTQAADRPIDERYRVALEKFENVTKKYSGTASALNSLIYIGDCSYHLGNYDQAIEYYTTFINKSRKDNYLRSFAFEGLGYCYEGKGDYQQALNYFKKSIDESTIDTKALTYLDVARCYEALNDREHALEFYKKYSDGQGKSIFSELAQEKIEALKN